MKELFVRHGEPVLREVPAPRCEAGQVRIRVHYSAVSPGTEGGLLRASGRSFLSRAIEKRRRVDRLWQALRARDFDDIRTRLQRLSERGREWHAPGYSASGIVLECGAGVDAFAPGDRVAAAGASYATHAEIVSVPANLVVAVPPGCDLASASTVALGAIALQSVRRADSRLGETVLVLGLGMLGQMASRILLAAGCRVLGWDPAEERCAVARDHGVQIPAAGDRSEVAMAVLSLTGGRGADQVIVAASGGAEVGETGALAARRGGTLVLLGNTPVQVPRDVAYERELGIRLSTSYGPGRYDPRYEEEGIDYPFSHVRWTENRNMAAWCELLASHRVDIEDLVGEVRDLEEAAGAYLELRRGSLPSLGLIFRHVRGPEEGPCLVSPAVSAPPGARTTSEAGATGAPARRYAAPLRIAVLGTGSYASGVLLPVLAGMGEAVRLELLAGSTPARREPVAARFAFARTTSSHEEAASDPGVDLVVVATRHDRHADLVVRALDAGHAVFCEKPLALTLAEVDRIEAALLGGRRASAGGALPRPRRGSQGGGDSASPHADRDPAFLAIGFNRRFAPAVLRMMEELRGRRSPLQVSYRVQAGMLPDTHWIRGPQGGGRLIGEGVHMLDLLRHLAGAPLAGAWILPGGAGADPAADSFQVGLRYEDGTTASLLYTSRGSPRHPKERIEVHWDGRTLEIDGFARLTESGRPAPLWQAPSPQKGAAGLLDACARAMREGHGSPTPWPEVRETSRLAVLLEQARLGESSQARPAWGPGTGDLP